MNRNPHWSYVEFVCCFPECDQLLAARKDGWLTANEFAIMNDMLTTLLGYAPPGRNDYDHAAILDDPAWVSVIAAAQRAKQMLLAITTDQMERMALQGNRN